MFNNNSEDGGFQIDENAIDFSFESSEPQDITTDDSVDTGTVDNENQDVIDSPTEEDEVDVDEIFNNWGEEETDEEEVDETSEEDTDSEDEPEKPKKKPGPKESGIVSTFKLLKEKGILDFDDDEEIDEDSAKDLIEDGFDRAVDNKVGEILGELDDTRKGIIKFIANGGDLSQLSSVVGNKDISAFDISKESDQVRLVKKYLTESDFGDADEIEAQVQFLKDRGTLEKQAKKFYEKEEAKTKKQEQALLEQQQQAKEEAKIKAREFKKKLVNTIEENPEINDFTFSRKDKDLPDYINDATIKLENGKTMSPFYKDLYGVMQDPKKLVLLAKIVRSDFDFSNIKNKVVTTTTKKIKDNVERTKNPSVNKKSSQKRLIDYLDD